MAAAEKDAEAQTCFLPGSQLKANALIKRGSMYMQQQQSLLSTQDFNMAAEMDTRNPDVYHHRGQVGGAALNSLAAGLARPLINVDAQALRLKAPFPSLS